MKILLQYFCLSTFLTFFFFFLHKSLKDPLLQFTWTYRKMLSSLRTFNMQFKKTELLL